MPNCNRSIDALILAAALLSSPPSQAQPSGQDPELITVTATRSARNLSEVSRAVSVVTSDQIAARQGGDVLRILRELPGVSAASNGGLAGQLVLRGFSTQGFRAPLFVDGDRFRGRNTIEYTLFNPNQIERIEVVRGPASSLYGTDSLGGVINIITKRAEGDISGPFQFDDNAVQLEYGSVNDLSGGRVQMGGTGAGFDVLMGINYRQADDYESPAGNINNSGFEAPGIDLRAGYTFDSGDRLELIGRYADVERERAGGQFAAPGSTNAPGSLQREMTDRSNKEQYLRLGFFADSAPGTVLSDFEATFYWRDLETHVNVVPNNNNPTTFVDVFVVGPTIYGGHLKGVRAVNERFSLTLGGDWYYEDRPGSERSVRGGPRAQRDPDTDQLSIGVYALGEWQASATLRLNGSLRFDHLRTGIDTSFITDPETLNLFSAAGDLANTPITGSLGAILDLSEQLQLVGSVSTSFRAPSVTELSAVGNGVNPVLRLPNTEVDPEKGVNYEAGLRYRNIDFQFDLIGFYNELEDLINRDAPTTFNGEPAVQMRNIGEATVRGVELLAAWNPMTNLQLVANATYTHGTDDITDTPLSQIMPWNGTFSANWQAADGLFLEGVLEWATEQDRIDPAMERSNDSYAIVNLSGGFELNRLFNSVNRAVLRLSVENLFDEEYRLPTTPENINLPVSPSNPLLQPGRNFLLGLSMRF